MGQIPSGIVHVFYHRGAVSAIECSFMLTRPPPLPSHLTSLSSLFNQGGGGGRGVGGLDVTGSGRIRDLDT